MSEGLPDLVSHVRLDTTGVATGVAKTKAELGGLGGATKGLQGEFKSLLGSITSLGPGTSALSGQFSSFGGAAKSAVSSVAGEGLNLKSVMTGVGVGVAGVGVALAGLALEGISKFTAAAGEVRKLQATLGSTAEDASKLRNVAIGLGVDVDTMGKALFKLGPILEKNKGDIGGVNVELAKNADGSSNLVGTLANMRTAYQSITDPVQRSQFALDAFKKTGLELRPILASTNEQFAQLAKTGPIFNDRDLKAARDLSIAQRELKQSVDTAEIALAKGLVPALTHASTAATNAIGGIQGFVEHLSKIKSEGGPAAAAVSGLEKAVGLAVKNITPLGSVLDVLGGKHKDAGGSAAAQAEKEKAVAAALEETTKKADAAAKALDALVTAQESALDKDLALEHSLNSLERAITDNAKAHRDAEKAVQEYGRASDEADSAVNAAIDSDRSLKDQQIAVAKATRDAAVAHQEAAGATVSATDKVVLLVSALRNQASHLAPGSELRRNLEDYATQLENGIPAEKNTHVTVETADAEADIARLKAHLQSLGTTVIRPRVQDTGGDNASGVYADSNSGGSAPSGGSSDTSFSVTPDSARGNRLGVNSVIPFAGGGRTSGFRTNGPRFLVGEGNPRYPETVIASDPQFRTRNLGLYAMAGRDLGVGGGDGAAMDYGALAAALAPALAAAVAAEPIRSYVVASDLARGLSKAGPR